MFCLRELTWVENRFSAEPEMCISVLLLCRSYCKLGANVLKHLVTALELWRNFHCFKGNCCDGCLTWSVMQFQMDAPNNPSAREVNQKRHRFLHPWKKSPDNLWQQKVYKFSQLIALISKVLLWNSCCRQNISLKVMFGAQKSTKSLSILFSFPDIRQELADFQFWGSLYS